MDLSSVNSSSARPSGQHVMLPIMALQTRGPKPRRLIGGTGCGTKYMCVPQCSEMLYWIPWYIYIYISIIYNYIDDLMYLIYRWSNDLMYKYPIPSYINIIPKCSMYGIFMNIYLQNWVILVVNVGKYSIWSIWDSVMNYDLMYIMSCTAM